MNDQEIDPGTVEKEDVVQYENKHHAAAIVKVEDVGFEDREKDQYQRIEVRVLESIFGTTEKEETINLGRTTDEALQRYIGWKLKTPGTMTDYVDVADLEDHRNRMIEISKTYGP